MKKKDKIKSRLHLIGNQNKYTDQAERLKEYTWCNRAFARVISMTIPVNNGIVIALDGEFLLAVVTPEQVELHRINRGQFAFMDEKGKKVDIFDGMIVKISDLPEEILKDKGLTEIKTVH